MVDIVSPSRSVRTDPSGPQTAETSGEGRTVLASVHAGKGEITDRYSALCRRMTFAPAQSPAWISAWARNTPDDILVVELSEQSRPFVVLALETETRGPVRIARFVGGRHANGNFPATDPHARALPGLAAPLQRALRRARPDIDMLALERQSREVGGVPNPLLSLRHRQSPNVALAADLSGGFEALLGRVNGKRKRKRHRAQIRKFEAAGGARHLQARTPEEVERFLSAFLAMKAAQFAKAGLPDSFADERTRAALTCLFREACPDERPAFILQALEVGGKLRAVSGSSRTAQRMICDFTAFADDELASAGPGDFLFFENIRAACEEGFELYDFSVGDERYKREWCDIETRHCDVFLPLSPRGRILAEASHALSGAKRLVKAHAAAERLLATARRHLPRRR